MTLLFYDAVGDQIFEVCINEYFSGLIMKLSSNSPFHEYENVLVYNATIESLLADEERASFIGTL